MKLLYFFIQDYKALHDVGFHLDPQFSFKTDAEYSSGILPGEKELKKCRVTIGKGQSLPNDFWGNNVNALASIVGSNGSGKSSAVDWLMNMVVAGMATKNEEGFIIFQDNSDLKFYASKNFKDKIKFDFDGADLEDIIQVERPPQIETIFYTGHFEPYEEMTVRSSSFQGETNISDSACLLRDLQNYSNGDTQHLITTMFDHFRGFYLQNMYRISLMLIDKEYLSKIRIFKTPRFINFKPNESIKMAVRNPIYIPLDENQKGRVEALINAQDWNKYTPTPSCDALEHSKSFALNEIFMYSLLNFCVEQKKLDLLEIIIKDWNNISGDFLSGINEFFPKLETNVEFMSLRAANEYLVKMKEIAIFLHDNCEFHVGLRLFYIDVETSKEEKRSKLKNILEEISKSAIFVVARFFDLYFCHNFFSNSTLSSGEWALLNLTSRLHYILTEKLMRGIVQIPKLFILDEGDNAFHPEWQRRYVNIILECLNALMPEGHSLQVIYTTHSPLSLSDLPNRCINFLEVNDEGKTVSCFPDIETFATNVFTLYRDAFFMQNGMIGEFAKNYIEKLSNIIENGVRSRDEAAVLNKEIELIGDPYVRGFLQKRLKEQFYDIDMKIELLEQRLALLKRERDGQD